ncbi:unnamed protein product [Ixodes persulcatus]
MMTFSDQNKIKRERQLWLCLSSKRVFIYLFSCIQLTLFLHTLISCNANVESCARCFVVVVFISFSWLFVALAFFFYWFTKIRFFIYSFFFSLIRRQYFYDGPRLSVAQCCMRHAIDHKFGRHEFLPGENNQGAPF